MPFTFIYCQNSAVYLFALCSFSTKTPNSFRSLFSISGESNKLKVSLFLVLEKDRDINNSESARYYGLEEIM